MAAAAFADPYVSPSTGLLVNKLGIRDEAVLRTFEYEQSALRVVELRDKPIEGRFDLAHLAKVHEHLFQDVYDWAGKMRTVNISKGGTSFARVEFIEGEANKLAAQLQKENGLKGLEKPAFVERLSHYYAEWNALHPFREGNGRSTRELVGQLARQAGYELDQTRIDNDKGQWNEAAKRSFNGDLSGVKQIFAQAVRPSRAIAFEKLPRNEALRKHPELAVAYQVMDSTQGELSVKYAGQPKAYKHFLDAARAELVRKMDSGALPAPIREKAAPARLTEVPVDSQGRARHAPERLLVIKPEPAQPAPGRAKAFQAVHDNLLARDDALKLYPELRPAFNTMAVAKLRYANNPQQLESVRGALQGELNAGRVPEPSRQGPQRTAQELERVR